MIPDDKITVICATKRPLMVERLLANLSRQSERSWRALICLHAIPLLSQTEAEISNDPRIKILSFGANATLGDMLNRAVWDVDTPYACKWDDDDYYGKWFLSETIQSIEQNRGDLVGKAAWYAWIEDQQVLYHCYSGAENRLQTYLAGGTLAARTDLFRAIPFISVNLGEDQTFVRDVARRGGRVWATSKHGYVHVRAGANHGHAWNVALSDYLKGSKYVASSLDLRAIEGSWQPADFDVPSEVVTTSN